MILGGDFNAKIKIDHINQNESRNGKILQDTIDKNDLITATTSSNKKQWPTQEWNNPEKRSVVYYILTTKYITNNTTAIVIDEDEAFKIKTKDGTHTDHKTIIMNIKINNPRRKIFMERWKTNKKEGWQKFNTELQRSNQTNLLAKKKYKEIEKTITQTLKETIGIQNVRREKPRKPTAETADFTE